RRRHTRSKRDWSSDVCSSDLLVSCRRGPRLKVGGMRKVLPDQLRADGLPLLVGYETAVGSVRKEKLGETGYDIGINDARYNESRSEERRVGKEDRSQGWRSEW